MFPRSHYLYIRIRITQLQSTKHVFLCPIQIYITNYSSSSVFFLVLVQTYSPSSSSIRHQRSNKPQGTTNTSCRKCKMFFWMDGYQDRSVQSSVPLSEFQWTWSPKALWPTMGVLFPRFEFRLAHWHWCWTKEVLIMWTCCWWVLVVEVWSGIYSISMMIIISMILEREELLLQWQIEFYIYYVIDKLLLSVLMYRR